MMWTAPCQCCVLIMGSFAMPVSPLLRCLWFQSARTLLFFLQRLLRKKGATPEAVRQLATWIQEAGLVHVVQDGSRSGD